ncbi:lectin BRA-3-like [Amphibalanus amphitrite]|uniref:lectin BRA-3-like n=1 Tax=Amphibalanus amphitrite TaxID=1232801 RepID=UPI001C91C9F0|nr:lectin BRA-3-like [Amphibalanus amphitrite]XP_043235450.1 lectin BRA-3-like [Amphibalanus amphitrite]XP_043235451.1 lectin BRA-3-like [Amphibalanus amphitrite]XP_043235452.1 lectin BRA-3-like [Amphibalanus amphitrite]XP_043235453.1 lectin BRA-3-like [Amphibalanus amphitrite]XP_043235454.1 lectin BRA-3-like [Amphibalanus amphitrite]XP_043235455.1 lectin BRA-3-like [Amphibalanus amphitrite]
MSPMPRLAALLLAVITAVLSCPSPDWLALTDGECYLPLVPPFSSMDADEAVQTCHFFGADVTLPEVLSAPSQERVHLLTGGNSAWLGLRRANSSSPWLWQGGRPANYTHWKDGQPYDTHGRDCVYMDRDGYWSNVDCSYNCFVICYYKLA